MTTSDKVLHTVTNDYIFCIVRANKIAQFCTQYYVTFLVTCVTESVTP
jgi:hypothetical protein